MQTAGFTFSKKGERIRSTFFILHVGYVCWLAPFVTPHKKVYENSTNALFYQCSEDVLYFLTRVSDEMLEYVLKCLLSSKPVSNFVQHKDCSQTLFT